MTRPVLVAGLLALLLGLAGGCRADAPSATPALRPTLVPLGSFQRGAGVGGFATATPWPTFTPAPVVPMAPLVDPVVLEQSLQEPALTPAPFPGAAGAVAPASTQPRFACVVDYRRWLTEDGSFRGGDAQSLKEGLAEFRQLRPDCGRGRFEPVFRAGALCDDENRVAGVTVAPQFSLGRDYNHNVRLGPTGRTGRGDFLIHFERFPDRVAGGCWYYDSNSGRWHEETATTSVSVPTVVPTPDPAEFIDYLACEAELQFRIEELAPPADYDALNGLILEASTGLSDCAVGWYPLVSETRVAPDCPEQTSGVTPDGAALVHWSIPPSDGSSCWIYELGSDYWELR